MAALLVVYLKVPAYSAVKAGYALGMLPCGAVLCCAGLDVFMRGAFSRAAVGAGMACWATAAYLSYLAR